MNIKLAILFVVGLLIGGTATALFMDSAPPPVGSAEAKATALQSELVRAKSQIALLEAKVPKRESTPSDHARESTAKLLDDMKHGRPVDADRVFQHFKPLMRDLAPLLAHLRSREERKDFARTAENLRNTYQLNDAQQHALEQWLGERAMQQADKFNRVAYADNSKLEDIMKASKYLRPERPIDEFMESNLRGSTLERYRSDRLQQRASNVEHAANTRVDRLDAAVQLDETQKDRIFSLMARSSPDFDPRMKFAGLGSDTHSVQPGQDREKAIQSVLRPDQRARYEAYKKSQLDAANREAKELGITMPENLDVFEEQ